MKRTTNISKFGQILSEKIDELRITTGLKDLRVYRIESPEARKDITIVLESKFSKHRNALTYRADGTFSGLSYWTEGQI